MRVRRFYAMSLLRSVSGHITNLSTPSHEDGGPLHHVAYFPSTAEPFREGFVRVVNRSAAHGIATILCLRRPGRKPWPGHPRHAAACHRALQLGRP